LKGGDSAIVFFKSTLFKNNFNCNIFRNIFCLFCLPILFYCFLLSISYADQHTAVKPGDRFPNISLTNQLSIEDKKYLGLSVQKAHSLSCIRASFILIDCLSIYCPICQAHADKFNRLHKLIQEDNFLSSNIKMIGIGLGNNSKEVTYFKKYFNVSFPIIPDPDYKIHKALNETRTPLLTIIDKRANPYKILTILDFTKEPEILLKDIKTHLLKYKSEN
jgi:peroxiredoxin